MENKRCNGWTNYETWLCNLWLDNDGMTDEIAEWAQECLESAIENGESDIRASATTGLEDRIKAHVEDEDLMPQVSGMYADLLNAALQNIDYREIASHYIDDIELWVAGWNMPGYMPDSTPAVFTDFDTAKAYIVEELERYAEDVMQGDDAEDDFSPQKQDQSRVEDGKAWVEAQKGEFSGIIGAYCFWAKKE